MAKTLKYRNLKNILVYLSLVLYTYNLPATVPFVDNDPCFKWVYWDTSTISNGGSGQINTIRGSINLMRAKYTSDFIIKYETPVHVAATISPWPAGVPVSNYNNMSPPGSDTAPDFIAIMNEQKTTNTLEFMDGPVTNPILAFTSVGGPGVANPVEVKFNNLTSPLRYLYADKWSQGSLETGPTSFRAKEGYFLVELPGTYRTVEFEYTVAESRANFIFGYNSCVCGDGDLDPGEQCDLGNRNGLPDLGCTEDCAAMSTHTCSGLDVNEDWIEEFDTLITRYSQCIGYDTSVAGTTAIPLCDNASLTDIRRIKDYHKYVLAINTACNVNDPINDPEGFYGTYYTMELGGQKINIKCTDNSDLNIYERQLPSITEPWDYTTLNNTACDPSDTPIHDSNLYLDRSIKNCGLYCDDNPLCKYAVESTDVSGSQKCQLFDNTCSTTPGSTGKTLFTRDRVIP